jgi:hypothetical protein
MLYDSPVTRPHRRRSLYAAFAGILATTIVVLLTAAPGFGASGPQSCTSNNQQGRLCLTLSSSPDPVAYSTATGNSYLKYTALLRNDGNSNLSHVGLRFETLPAGTTLFRVTPSQGSCPNFDFPVQCALGSLGGGDTATVEVVITAPLAPSADPPDGLISLTNVFAAFDENFNDQNGGKQDTILYACAQTGCAIPSLDTVVKASAETFIPQGGTGEVNTDPDPTLKQHGKATIDQPSTDVFATLDLVITSNPTDPLNTSFCPSNGQVKIGKKVYVCRQGGYIAASVTCATTPPPSQCTGQGHYIDPNRPLKFHLIWAASLVSSKQSVKNFVVFYQPDGSSQVQVIDARCGPGNPPTNLPCIRNISKNQVDGSWSVDLFRPDNGHMR